jgi:hypothetical protein
MDFITRLVDYIFSSADDAEMKAIWRKMIQDYSDAMKILRKWSEYTENDIKNFKLKIDDFFAAYVEQSGAGKEVVTNYIHMLGSSHISYYMKTHDNLYKYSQQGWESRNDKVKLSFLIIPSVGEILVQMLRKMRSHTLSQFSCFFSANFYGFQD